MNKMNKTGFDFSSEAKTWLVLAALVAVAVVALMLAVAFLGPQYAFLFLLLPLACVVFLYRGVKNAAKQKKQKQANRSSVLAAFGLGTTSIGVAGALGGACHAACLWAIGFLAAFGITVVGMPLMFFEDPGFFVPFLVVGGISLAAAACLAWRKKC